MKDVEKFAKEKGHGEIRHVGFFNGYNVYEPITEDVGITFYCGFPVLILEKEGEIRETLFDEYFVFANPLGLLED